MAHSRSSSPVTPIGHSVLTYERREDPDRTCRDCGGPVPMDRDYCVPCDPYIPEEDDVSQRD